VRAATAAKALPSNTRPCGPPSEEKWETHDRVLSDAAVPADRWAPKNAAVHAHRVPQRDVVLRRWEDVLRPEGGLPKFRRCDGLCPKTRRNLPAA